jgi:hypothetical protein
MTPFEILLVSHLVIDWIFQTKTEAYGKLTEWWTRFNHCIFYGTMMTLITFIMLILKPNWVEETDPLIGVVITFAFLGYYTSSHFLFDTPDVKKWIAKNFRKEEEAPLWYYLGLDQILHILSLVPAVIYFNLQ